MWHTPSQDHQIEPDDWRSWAVNYPPRLLHFPPSLSSGLIQRGYKGDLFFHWKYLGSSVSFPGGPSGKEPPCQCRRQKRWGFAPWVRKIPWRRTWQPTPVFLPGESHGQRSLAGCSPWGHRVGHNWAHTHKQGALCQTHQKALNSICWRKLKSIFIWLKNSLGINENK